MMKKTVEVVVDFGELKPVIQKAAKQSGVSMNEFICNALDSQVRRDREHQRDNYVRHGGKHLMGKHTGYEVTEDGKYYPAPSWIQHFEQLFAERSAVYNLINAVVAQAQERLIEVEKQIIKTKDRLVDDLGLDPNRDWVYYGDKGYMKEHKTDTSSTRDTKSAEGGNNPNREKS